MTVVNLVGIAASFLVLVIGFGSHHWWLSDLMANLRIHAIAAGIVFAGLYSARFRRTWTVIAIAVAIVVLPGLSVFPAEDFYGTESSDRRLRILSLNLGHADDQRAEIVKHLAASDADVIVLQELSSAWGSELATLESAYPFTIAEPRAGSFGIAMLSRIPIENGRVIEFLESNIPYTLATLDTELGPVSIMGLHLNWPMTNDSFADRNRQIGIVINQALTSDTPFIACGDWNLTTHSGWYDALQDAGLAGEHAMAGGVPTWPSPFGWFGISIDHCMAGHPLSVHAKKVGPPLGSDHRPVFFTITSQSQIQRN